MHHRPHLSRSAPGGLPFAPAVLPAAPGVVAAALGMLLAAALAGCSSGGSVSAAPDGGGAPCASLLGRLPATVADQNRGTSSTPGTARWGRPAIEFRCGVRPPGPTTIPCVTVNGVDWLFEQRGDDLRLTTFGRRPAVEVTVPAAYGRDLASAALVDLAPAITSLPADRHCS